MSFFDNFSFNSCLQVTTSQFNSLYEATKSTLGGWKESTHHYTLETAKYIFDKKKRTPERRNRVLFNFVTPLSMAVTATALINKKAAVCLTVATAIYTLVVAKKKGLLG